MLKKNTIKTKGNIKPQKTSANKNLPKTAKTNKTVPDPLFIELLHEQIRERILQDKYPSKISSKPWVVAINEIIKYPNYTVRSGKWCVFVNKSEHDDWWAKIKQALNEGQLGDQIKTSTGLKSPLAVADSKAVIIIYTYDYEDKDDVMRIRNELRELGIQWKVTYKPDKATKEGKYSNRGDAKISIYYE